jgi:hypothetical protein
MLVSLPASTSLLRNGVWHYSIQLVFLPALQRAQTNASTRLHRPPIATTCGKKTFRCRNRITQTGKKCKEHPTGKYVSRAQVRANVLPASQQLRTWTRSLIPTLHMLWQSKVFRQWSRIQGPVICLHQRPWLSSQDESSR